MGDAKRVRLVTIAVLAAVIGTVALAASLVGQWGRRPVAGIVEDVDPATGRFVLRSDGWPMTVAGGGLLPDTVFVGNGCTVRGTALGLVVLPDQVVCRCP